MAKFNWSDKSVLLLIEKVKEHPVIWNNALQVFKSKTAKRIIWKKIVEDMNNECEGDLRFTYGELLKKWRNMKSYFTHEIKIQKIAKSRHGAAETEYLENSWKFYQNMLFLKEIAEHNSRNIDESAFDISDGSRKHLSNLKITKTYVKMETSDNTVKKDKFIDPLEISEENNQWCICGNILVNLVNLNYLIECIICKNNFCDNEIFMKHVHANHSDIFTEDLKQEFETPTIMTLEENSEQYYENPEFEMKLHVNELNINTSDCKEISSNEENFDKISNIESDSQLEISDSNTTVQFKAEDVKSEVTSESTSLKISFLNKKVKAKQEKKKKVLKRKYNSSDLKDGIPDSLSIQTNGIYQCTQCSQKYTQFTELRNHFWARHTYQFRLNDENCVPDLPGNCPNPVDNYYHCTACLGRFRTYDRLMTHFILHPGAKLIENKPFKCSYCNATFLTMRRLKFHEVVHNSKRPFICEICFRDFKRKENLVEHVRIHNNDRRYKCNFCNKSWYTKYQRQEHELIHSNSKPNVCEICGVAYRLKSRLVRHMRRHTGEKKFKCNFCEKSFYDSGNLVENMRVHTGEKKYICKICQHSFARRVHLRTHEQLHSEDKNYICEICNMGFKQNAGLYSHMKCVHGHSKPMQKLIMKLN